MNTDQKETSGTILVVDDEINNLHLLTDLLTQYGYKVRATKTGNEAILSIQSSQPDLILLDIKLPDIDGYEVCKLIKANVKMKDIPVLFLSALKDTGDIVHGFEVGGEDFITKPFKTEEALARVKTHIQLKRNYSAVQKEIVQSGIGKIMV